MRAATIIRTSAWLVIALVAWACEMPPPTRTAPPKNEVSAPILEEFIQREMADKDLAGLSIALLDGDRVVWSRGFGWADAKRQVAATPKTVYRVGSISKLFTDIAVMRLVENGVLDLDAPVQEYLPEFAPRNPFGRRITLRHLMAHRSGLVREPPVGHYFDPTEPTLAATVASLNQTSLVYAPGTVTKYSNAGIAVVGRVLEVVTGDRFSEHVARELVRPAGLFQTSFSPVGTRGDKGVGRMWSYDGREFVAPTFELGMEPAANLYSTVEDLVMFARSWFTGLARSGAPLLTEDSLREMYRSQFDGQSLGLGFFTGEVDGYRRVGHGGAMYGFATELAALPDEGFAVAVVTNTDFANAVTERIADVALRWLVARREGRPFAIPGATLPVGAERASVLAGAYGPPESRVDLYARGEELFAAPASGAHLRLRGAGDRLIADGRVAHGRVVELRDGALVWGGQPLARVTDASMPAPPSGNQGELVGEYGWDFNTLYVLERDGALYVLIEWLIQYPIRQESSGDFRLPDHGMYAGESVRFLRGEDGRVSAVEVGGVTFPRRPAPAPGRSFRVTPRLTESALRAAAAVATPPSETGRQRRPDLVEPVALDASIKLDIRYATTNNFLGIAFYERAQALLQRPAAEALVRVHRGLAEHGYGLLIHDAYRPWFVTKMFFDGTPEHLHEFVADPSQGSRHNRGCAVDVTLYDLETGAPVSMPSGYDEFTPRASIHYLGGTAIQRWHRDLLRRAMEAEGFSVYAPEWWHFDYQNWREYPILNARFR